ncbi:TPA: hypothetical protein KD131_001305 [Vibrio parahaemolyticus]|nr:hypothetical protein [Vibrio parahaemolyticus]ELA9724162.1 hypothetical protein [Vibrio parahaemolyticus]HBC3609362.1 hypothetical protein [Vibrio parahaemolyticus]
MEKDSNDQLGLVNATQQAEQRPYGIAEPLTDDASVKAEPVVNEEFLRFYSTYPKHRRMDVLDAESAWNNAELSDEEVIVLLNWLKERQEEDPSWHPRATGMYVPKLDSFLKQRWWLSPKARMRP